MSKHRFILHMFLDSTADVFKKDNFKLAIEYEVQMNFAAYFGPVDKWSG